MQTAREELAQYITLEMGKLITESRGEVDLRSRHRRVREPEAHPGGVTG
jgi:acyl-CoA reductase-like NAD-dependent aldehyde dehydrogenase